MFDLLILCFKVHFIYSILFGHRSKHFVWVMFMKYMNVSEELMYE